ncbi:MAG: PD-(D/E)XK nuclease family protein [Oscillospiraceae bacterium]|jgi:ATP-dependent helicase/nuclease subunit B|nr:PD-(D/E)XK nuclease family protein [Oscillospiraceae bacterium]
MRFLWSRAGRGGDEALLSELLDAAGRGETCRWIVPEPYSHATERLLASRGGASVCLYAEVLTFRRLCDQLLAAGGGLAFPVLDGGGRLLVMRRAVRSVAGQLKALNILAAKPGFLPGLIQALDECKCYRVTPGILERAGAETPGVSGVKLFDLALIFAAYDMFCAQGAMDPRDRVTLAWEKAKSVRFCANSHLFVSHFASFTPQERLLLTALADGAASFTILFCGELGERGFAPLHATARQFAAHFPREVEHITVDRPSQGRSPAIQYMEKCWFDRAAVRRAFVQAGELHPERALSVYSFAPVELYAAPCEAAEVRFAAESAVRLVRDEGYRWRDIAVIASDYTAYAPLIESLFPQYRVPVFSDRMDEMSQKPLSRCIRAAADCVLYGYRADDVMRLLRTELLPVPASDADLTENYLRRWNPRGGRFSGKSDWTRPPGGWHGEPSEAELGELARINAVRRRVASALKKLSGKTARQCAEGLYRALEALGVPEGIEARTRALTSAGEHKLAAECGQMWELFCKSLDQCAGLLGDEEMAAGEFCELCLLVLSGYSVGSIPASLDRVHTGDQSRFPRLPFPAVIYIGACGDKVPARSSGEGLLSGEERAALAEAGCELPPDPPARIERELYNLYTACTLPSQKLIVTYPSARNPKDDGRADFIDKISGLFGVPVKPVPPPAPPVNPVAVLRCPLSAQSAAALYGNTLRLSASRVETFSLCPFSYFMRYGLRAALRPEPGFTPLDVGRELHVILEQCARYVMERGGFAALPKEEVCRFAERQARARQDEVLRRGGVGTPRLLAQGARLARAASMLAGRMWDEFVHSKFTPLGFELPVESLETPLTGLSPEAPSSYKLRGVADRADGFVKGDTLYLRVVDYKTGGKSFSLSDVCNGLSAQMPLYLFLLRRLAPERFGVPKAEAAGVLYVSSREVTVRSDRPLTREEAEASPVFRHSGLLLGDPELLEAMDDRVRRDGGVLPVSFNRDGSFSKRASVASPEEMDALQTQVGRLVRDMAREVARGRVDAAPLDLREAPCGRCDYRAACHFDETMDKPRPYVR